MINSQRFTLKNVVTAVTLFFIACSAHAQIADKKSKALLNALKEVNGGYQHFASKKDFEFTYTYSLYGEVKDISLERHIIDGEHTWGRYELHKHHVLPNREGIAIQSLVHGKPAVTLNGKHITKGYPIKSANFHRRVNFYWFSMMYKLEDPGTIFKYLGKQQVGNITYDRVSLQYDAGITKKEFNDEYILYFNPKTHLIDEFYFSVPEFGFVKPDNRMILTYERVDGLLLTTTRQVYDKKGKIRSHFTYTNIKFNNGFKPENFEL